MHRLEFFCIFMYRVLRNLLFIMLGGVAIIIFIVVFAYIADWIDGWMVRYPMEFLIGVVIIGAVMWAIKLALEEG